jgi:serine protease AprX
MQRLMSSIALTACAFAVLAGAAGAAPARDGGLPLTQRAALSAHVAPERIQADSDGDKLFDNLAFHLQQARPSETLDVIVRYKPGQEGAAAGIESRVFRHLKLDHSVGARLTAEQIRALVASGAVESIEEDSRCYATRESSQASFGVTKARADFGLTGDGDGDPGHYSARDHTIVVIDTGIDAIHPDFAGGKIIAWKDYVNGRSSPYDDDGHGTHCASIAAGRVINGVGGVAPGAALISLKVLGKDGGSTATIASAVEWCIQNRQRYGIEVVSMSLGSGTSSNGTDALSRMVDRAAETGLVVCVAAGNSGPDSYTIGSPAAAETAITVGNMIDLGKGGFALRPTSSRGPTADGRVKPDLCAPGYDILAAQANTGGYVKMGGTSMACPFVAGVATLMIEADPRLAPDKVKLIMKATAVHFGPSGWNNEFGAGRLDGYAALAVAYGADGIPPLMPDHLYAGGSLSGKGVNQFWRVPVADVRFPLALTEIMQSTSADFDLYLYDPSGRLVAKSESTTRQETILFAPSSPGYYIVEVYSYSGAGSYSLDVSARAGG